MIHFRIMKGKKVDHYVPLTESKQVDIENGCEKTADRKLSSRLDKMFIQI